MHARNPYIDRYNLKDLADQHPALNQYLILNPSGEDTIDFSLSAAVFELNKALLLVDFKLTDYHLPTGYLIPPIPGRLDYLLHLQDFLQEQFKTPLESKLHGLDIGTGANGIYCILGAQKFGYSMVGTECDAKAVAVATANVKRTKRLHEKIDIRHQTDKSFLLKTMIKPNEHFDFTVCNPPFHASKEEALKGSLRKLRNLDPSIDKTKMALNFEGQANELWCNGGEALFIKRLIKESILYKSQVTVFSSLVSRTENLSTIKKQIQRVKANYHSIPMSQGHKKSRCILWWFD